MTASQSKPAVQSGVLWGTAIAGIPALLELIYEAAGSGLLGSRSVAIAAVVGSAIAAVRRLQGKPVKIEGVVSTK